MKKIALFALLATTAVTGCARVKEELGINRRTPDEFAVVKRAPLEIPPNLNEVSALPPPRPGAPRPQETSPQTEAQAALLKGAVPVSTESSAAENALLQKTGAVAASPSIRSQVDKEAKENADKNRPVIKRLMNMGNKDDPGGAVIVDAPAEADRIKKKEAGETPSIEE